MAECITEGKESFKFWEAIEKIIKNRESAILLLLIIGVLVFIPFKILSYGWTPSDDASRHVAFSTIDTKWSDILVIDEKYDTDHNAGWHQVLKFLYKYCGLDKQDLMFFSVAGLFLLVNICGLLSAPSAISWCVALLLVLNTDYSIFFRLLSGRPYLVSCASTLIVLFLWSFDSDEKAPQFLKKKWLKYLLTIIALSLGVWIHGSWYLFLLIPLSFFIAGETKKSLILTGLVLVSTVIGAMLTGDFLHFLYYHFNVTLSIYSEKTYSWLLVSENAQGGQSINWIPFTAIIVFLCMKKCGYKLSNIASDPIFMMVLLCWLGSIWVIRFWVDWGRICLILWLSYRIHDLIKCSYSLKKPRIRYCLTLFIIIGLTLSFINDGGGRYTKEAFNQAIDFYNESTLDKLKGWEPQEGGIVYSDSMYCFYQHFYQYPTAKWKYILGFESAIMKKEDRLTLRNIGYSSHEEEFAPWVNKMTEKDRLIIAYKLTSARFPQLEWLKGNRNWWIGRLKKKSESDSESESKPESDLKSESKPESESKLESKTESES
jgi:hypothetical protein